MARNHLEPFIAVQHSKKSMRPAVGSKIARACFVEKREGSFANGAKIREHGFFFGKKRRIERDRRFAADETEFDEDERDVEPAKERDGPGTMANDGVGSAEDGALDLAEMSDDFGGGPAAIGSAKRPVLRGNEVRGAKEVTLGRAESVPNGIENGFGHGSLTGSVAGRRETGKRR